MAIAVRSEIWGPQNLQPGQQCFYCHAEIKVVAVMWAGSDADLWLHPKCCQSLMLRMSRDCWEIECKGDFDRQVGGSGRDYGQGL